MKEQKNSSLVLIQSRLSSSRLPGKALLPIGGYPMVVLAASRAANTGKKVIVLTSTESSDDELCDTLKEHRVACFRGSLEDVLERFYSSTLDEEDNTLIFRLTADNVLPDGQLLDEMEQSFRSTDADIMKCTPEISNLPYGVSAELLTVGVLREAYHRAVEQYDREHVTPFIYRNRKSQVFLSSLKNTKKNLRVTIDTFDDYISVKSLFKNVSDPVNVPIQSLLSNVDNMKYRPRFQLAEKPMTLGTVQFGLNYGITNPRGRVPKDEAIEIIRNAITEGVEYIDTAAAYGMSEKVVGEALQGGWANRVKVITKTLPIESCNSNMIERLMVRNSVLKSCVNLRSTSLDTIMLHRAEQMNSKETMDELVSLSGEGIVKNIGVSVQHPAELKNALSLECISIIQMPFNILDHRWDELLTMIKSAKKHRKLLIHARSALLQGLLCSENFDHWKRVGVQNGQEVVNWLDKKHKEYDTSSVAELCIRYVNSQAWIDSVVIGVDSIENLFANLSSVSKPLFHEKALSDIENSRPQVSEETLNPATWS